MDMETVSHFCQALADDLYILGGPEISKYTFSVMGFVLHAF